LTIVAEDVRLEWPGQAAIDPLTSGATAGFGTPGYAAPEQYRGTVTATSDGYGLAATLQHRLTGADPAAQPWQFPALAQLPPQVAA
jgi:serine/threonine-protein kinase